MAENRIVAINGSSIVLYSTDDGDIQLEVKLEEDSVWLNREQIAQLYGRDYKTIAKHINNALREELEGEPVVAKFAYDLKNHHHALADAEACAAIVLEFL